MLLGVVSLGFILIISVRGKIARRNAEQPSPRELIESAKATHQRREGVEAVSVDLLETAQRLGAQLDNKAQRLEQLMAQADLRLVALAKAARNPAAPGESASPAPGSRVPPPAAEPGEPARLDPLTGAVYELADTGRSPVEIAKELDEQVGKVELILALREERH